MSFSRLESIVCFLAALFLLPLAIEGSPIYSIKTSEFSLVLGCGLLTVVLIAVLISFGTLYYFNRTTTPEHPRNLFRFTLYTAITSAIISIAITFARQPAPNSPNFTALDAVGQSVIAAFGVWFALASLRLINNSHFPKLIVIVGAIVGVSWALLIYYFVLQAVNPFLSTTLKNIFFSLDFLIWRVAVLLWLVGIGVWLFRRKDDQFSKAP